MDTSSVIRNKRIEYSDDHQIQELLMMFKLHDRRAVSLTCMRGPPGWIQNYEWLNTLSPPKLVHVQAGH